jgi:head-tail adaptor
MIVVLSPARQATGNDDRGSAVDLDDAKAKFKRAWARIRTRLTDDDIAAAHEIAEASAEALARYETRRR